MGLIPGIQGWFNICRVTDVTHHISKIRDKIMIISIDAKKASDKVQHLNKIILKKWMRKELTSTS